MKSALTLILILILHISCNTKTKPVVENMDSSFERVNDSLAEGTSLILNREMENKSAPIGDFLSRLWTLYGKPNEIEYEGFAYTIRDKNSGLIFTAYSAGSGPAFGGKQEFAEKLKPIISRFNQQLQHIVSADCEIKIETDYGILKAGSKNGIPYDNYEE